MKKLHLGCGQRYFKGCINIDFPLSEHGVQRTSVADEFHDLLQLGHPAGSIDEVRLPLVDNRVRENELQRVWMAEFRSQMARLLPPA